jgi:dynein heavy chain
MSLPNPSEQTLSWIFSTITRSFLKLNNFKPEIIDLGETGALVNATLSIYNDIQRVLLPTPDRSHYVFNLRDVSKVFQGLLLARPTRHTRAEQVVRLWAHETCRVFMDRLINHIDQGWFKEQLVKVIYLFFKFDYKQADLFDGKPSLIFADFMKKGVELKDRVYDEVSDYTLLIKVIGDYMLEETKMNLVLFKDAVEHLSRIARALRLERGHFMLVGVGGSGKKSLTTLAAALAGC